jgi:uncharacterized integral membrane protein
MPTAPSEQAANGEVTGPRSRSETIIKWARLALAAIIVVLLIAFIVDNSEKVRVGFVFWHADVRLIWVLLITALLGALADRLVPRIHSWRSKSAAANRQSSAPQ